MNSTSLQPGEIDRHLKSMRLTTLGFLFTVPLAAALCIGVTARESMVSPMAVSLTAGAAARGSDSPLTATPRRGLIGPNAPMRQREMSSAFSGITGWSTWRFSLVSRSW